MNRVSLRTVSTAGILAAAVLGACMQVSASPWISAYYRADEYSTIAPASIDYNSITELMWFSIAPNTSGAGTLVDGPNETGAISDTSAVVTAVHNAGKKVLITIGGQGSETAFDTTFSDGHTSTLVSNIVSFVSTYGLDGVDLDDEPIQESDKTAFDSFVTSLRSSLPSGKLLTVAPPDYKPIDMFTAVASDFDQINVQTYDISGPWETEENDNPSGNGYYTWYNSPITSGGYVIPDFTPSTAMPSASSGVQLFITAGVSASKLAMATTFYGYDWTGATGPDQGFTFTPNLINPTNFNSLSYAQIMSTKYSSTYYHYDTSAHAAYLGITSTGDFVSYDDPTAIFDKVDYVEENGLGGLMCFSVGQQYISGATPNQPLLAAIDYALTIPFAQPITLLSWQTGYYASVTGSSDTLQANSASTVTSSDEFTVVNAGDGYVALLSSVTGKYVTVNTGSSDTLVASTATTIAAAEKFTWELSTHTGVIGLKSSTTGDYVTVDFDVTGDPLRATATSLGVAQEFTVGIE